MPKRAHFGVVFRAFFTRSIKKYYCSMHKSVIIIALVLIRLRSPSESNLKNCSKMGAKSMKTARSGTYRD